MDRRHFLHRDTIIHLRKMGEARAALATDAPQTEAWMGMIDYVWLAFLVVVVSFGAWGMIGARPSDPEHRQALLHAEIADLSTRMDRVEETIGNRQGDPR